MDPSKPKKHRFNLPLSGFSDEQLRRLQTIIIFAGFDTTLITADGSRLMFSDEYARDGYLRKAVVQYRGGKAHPPLRDPLCGQGSRRRSVHSGEDPRHRGIQDRGRIALLVESCERISGLISHPGLVRLRLFAFEYLSTRHQERHGRIV